MSDQFSENLFIATLSGVVTLFAAVIPTILVIAYNYYHKKYLIYKKWEAWLEVIQNVLNSSLKLNSAFHMNFKDEDLREDNGVLFYVTDLRFPSDIFTEFSRENLDYPRCVGIYDEIFLVVQSARGLNSSMDRYLSFATDLVSHSSVDVRDPSFLAKKMIQHEEIVKRQIRDNKEILDIMISRIKEEKELLPLKKPTFKSVFLW